MTDSPEITALNGNALYGSEFAGDEVAVLLSDAIQAVRDTEARVREERAVDFRPVSIESARREAFREAVEALREEYDIDSPLDWDDAARFIESRFLSHPDNPECDDEAVGEAIDDLGAASLRAAFDEVCDELDNPEGNA